MTARFWQNRLRPWLAHNPDDALLRWIFRGTVAVTIAMLAADIVGMNGVGTLAAANAPQERASKADDALPSVSPSVMPALREILAPLVRDGDGRTSPLPSADGALGKPMTFDLLSGGKLVASGTINAGTAEIFAAEVKKRGDYVKSVALNSPGGSVEDALTMGRLIRERKFSTEVESGKVCASSCPLVFAGGVERRAGEKAAIGVHQVFTPPSLAKEMAQRDGMNDAQRVSARLQRYLGEMGVSLQVWVHAMETPKERLFIFQPDELKSLNLVTAQETASTATTASAKK
jgi:hypothetical protein